MKILLFKTGAIGDTVMTTPLVRQLRKNYPDARIDYLIGKNAAQVLEGNKNLDEIIRFDPNIFFKKRLFQYIQLVRDIRKRKYDLIFVLDRHQIYNLTAKLMGVPKRVGFDRMGTEGKFLTHKVYFDGTRHEIYYYLDLLKKYGGKTNYKDINTEINLDNRDIKYAEDTWKKHKLSNRTVIAIAPGGANNPGQVAHIKIWPKEKYSKLINKILKENSKVTIIILGDNNDKPTSKYILTENHNNKQIIDLTSKTTIQETTAIMKKSDIVICNDTGPMHIASSVNKKIISIFGPSDPKRFAPIHKTSVWLWRNYKKYPCSNIYGGFDCDDNCINNILVDDVLVTIRDMMSHHLK
jgi:lipopolysaccharide heptosyltransferase II